MLGYPQHNIRFKHYGHTVETMVSKARLITDEAKRNQMILSIANFMKNGLSDMEQRLCIG